MLEQTLNFIDRLLGLHVDGRDLGVLQMSVRAIVVFVLAIAMVRIGDKRFLGHSTIIDIMLGIVFGSVVSRAITGNAPFFPALAAALVLVGAHFVFSAIAFRRHEFGSWVKGVPVRLVENGEVRPEGMRMCQVTTRDLEEAMRSHGHDPDIGCIRSAHMERNGEISIVLNEASTASRS